MNPALLLLAMSLVAQSPSALVATRAELDLEAARFHLDLWSDFDGLLLGVGPGVQMQARLAAMEALRRLPAEATQKRVERLRELLRRRVRVRFDGEAEAFDVLFPERRTTAEGELLTLGPVARLGGEIPQGAKQVTVFGSRSFRGIDLRISQGGSRSRQVLLPGAESSPVELCRVP